MSSGAAPSRTLRELRRRALVDAPRKALGLTLGFTGFFVLYFAIQNRPLFPVTVLATSWLDALVPFQAWTLLPYVSLWLYVSLPPILLTERRQLRAFAGGAAVLAAAGLAIFTLWPSAVPPPDLDWSRHPAIAFLKKADATGNACPSLHAAFAIYAALWLARLLPALGAGNRAQFANLLWAALIVHSTLGTKQHVALDALFGAILGAAVAALTFAARPAPSTWPITRRPTLLATLVVKLCAVLLWTCGLPLPLCLALFFLGGAILVHQLLWPYADALVRVRNAFTPSAPGAPEVWLTIDDGPDPDDTPRILDLLDQHQARATFFLVGERAARHPALVAEIARRGHEIAHHTHTHPAACFWCATPDRLRHELDEALAAFAAALPAGASPPRRFRPPVGMKNLFLGPLLAARGLDCIGWTIRAHDTFAHSADAVAARVARRLRPGAIILLHEGPPLRPEIRVHAIAAVLERLRAAGYRCVIPEPAQLR